MRDLEKEKHYYLEDGYVIFTSIFLSERGYCCGNKCRHCPYFPNHVKGNKNMDPKKEVNKKK